VALAQGADVVADVSHGPPILCPNPAGFGATGCGDPGRRKLGCHSLARPRDPLRTAIARSALLVPDGGGPPVGAAVRPLLPRAPSEDSPADAASWRPVPAPRATRPSPRSPRCSWSPCSCRSPGRCWSAGSSTPPWTATPRLSCWPWPACSWSAPSPATPSSWWSPGCPSAWPGAWATACAATCAATPSASTSTGTASHSPGQLIERIDGDIDAVTRFSSTAVLQLLGNAILVVASSWSPPPSTGGPAVLIAVTVADWPWP
jgi:hypothetical protein